MTDSDDPSPFPVVPIPPDVAADPERVVDFLLRHLVARGSVAEGAVAGLARGVRQREEMGSTAIGGGVAVPHCQADAVSEVAGVVGVSGAGVPWPKPVDGRPVHRVCLVVLPPGPLATVLRTLERLARQLRGP